MTPLHGRRPWWSRWLWLCNALIAVAVGSYVGCIGCSSGSNPSPPSTPEPPPSSGGPVYVSPQGLPTNDGSSTRPLDLATALSAQSPARPGQTVWLRGGTYRGAFVSNLAGRSDAPITVRGYPGERAILDGANPAAQQQGIVLQVLGSNTTFWGFEVTYSGTSRTDSGNPSTPNGIYANASSNIKFINLVVHDMPGQGFGVWSESVGVEVYGNIVFFNGTNHFDHAIYTQNATDTKRIEDNVLFGQASHGLHAYGSDTASLDHFLIAGNVSFNNGALLGRQERNILVGGGRVARDLRVTDNFTYYPPASQSGSNNIGYAAGCADATVTGNAFVGPNALTLVNCLPTKVDSNVFVGGTEPPDLSLIYPNDSYFAGLPGGLRISVRPNRYEPGRAHVIVYNWDLQSEILLDLAPAGLRMGQAFELRDVQDLFGTPVVTGTYFGAPIALPMTGLHVGTPVWNRAVTPRHTAPEFAVFLVIPR